MEFGIGIYNLLGCNSLGPGPSQTFSPLKPYNIIKNGDALVSLVKAACAFNNKIKLSQKYSILYLQTIFNNKKICKSVFVLCILLPYSATQFQDIRPLFSRKSLSTEITLIFHVSI